MATYSNVGRYDPYFNLRPEVQPLNVPVNAMPAPAPLTPPGFYGSQSAMNPGPNNYSTYGSPLGSANSQRAYIGNQTLRSPASQPAPLRLPVNRQPMTAQDQFASLPNYREWQNIKSSTTPGSTPQAPPKPVLLSGQQPQQQVSYGSNYTTPTRGGQGNNYNTGMAIGNATIGAGMNMLGGGSNLYGGQGAAVVPGGPIRVGGGGYGSLGSQLASEYQRAMNEGRAANENRYNQVLGGANKVDINDVRNGKYPGMTLQQASMHNGRVDASQVGYEGRFVNGMARQQEITQGYGDRYSRNMGYLEGAGQQEAKDINKAYDAQDARVQQNLAQRGLLNTTIAPNMSRGVYNDRQDAIGRLNDSLRRQRMEFDSRLSGDSLQAQDRAQQVESQLSGDRLGFMERRTDSYPSMSEYTNLMMQLGQSGMIGGGGGGQGQQDQLLGYGTMMNGVPMTYAGNQATSAYAGVYGTGGLNQASRFGWNSRV